MKLYLSSIRIPTPDDLAALLGRPSLQGVSIALIPNAKDQYSTRPWNFLVNGFVEYAQQLGARVDVVDLRDYDAADAVRRALGGHDLIWVLGGNTYMLRYQMKRSGFDTIVKELLESGVVYGGDSAGAIIAGPSIAGIEAADEPQYAEEIIKEGLHLVPFVPMPHADNPEFAEVMPVVRQMHATMIELKDSQAVVVDGDKHWVVESEEK